MKALAFIFIFLASNFYLSAFFPFATYTLSLALFGLLHVTQELGYINQRFYQSEEQRFDHHWIKWVIFLLFVIILIRFSQIYEMLVWEKEGLYRLELSVVWVLLAIVYFTFYQQSMIFIKLFTLLFILSILGYLIYDYPLELMLGFSIFHNFTPIFFFIEFHKNSYSLLNTDQKKSFMLIYLSSIFALIAIPLLIIVIQPIQYIPISYQKTLLLSAGNIYQHLNVFTLKSWWGEKPYFQGISIFSAVVFCQVMHYTLVIHILPRLQGWVQANQNSIQSQKKEYTLKKRLQWDAIKKNTVFIAISLGSFYLFFENFYKARQYYSLVASFHAWIELPLLLSLFLSFDQSINVKPPKNNI